MDVASEDGIIKIKFSRPILLDLKRRRLYRILADNDIADEYSEDSKEKLKKQTQRYNELDKSVKREQTYSEDLLLDKKVKLKELSD